MSDLCFGFNLDCFVYFEIFKRRKKVKEKEKIQTQINNNKKKNA